MKKIDLVIIDPQNDFCDPNGSLYVSGANKDMERLANFISKEDIFLNQIHISLDTHHMFDLAHPCFWVDKEDNNPEPFTIIKTEDIENKKWTPADDNYIKNMIDYTNALREKEKNPLCIWPPHCLIGSWGHNIFPTLKKVLIKWESFYGIPINYIYKGSNILTEHFSILEAEVVLKNDKSTSINFDFMSKIEKTDKVIFTGEAGSHCLKATVEDVIEMFFASDIILLEDTTSPVTGFENTQKEFIENIRKQGVQITTTKDFAMKG